MFQPGGGAPQQGAGNMQSIMQALMGARGGSPSGGQFRHGPSPARRQFPMPGQMQMPGQMPGGPFQGGPQRQVPEGNPFLQALMRRLQQTQENPYQAF